MNPGTTASLICPACGQAFLSMQQSMEGMVQCPHCAHNALRGYFGTQAQMAGVAQVRRRVSQAQPLPAMPAPAFRPAQEMHAFEQPAAWPGQPVPAVQAPMPMIRPTLQPSQALMPTGAAPPQPEEFVTPPHLRSSPWRGAFLMLAFALVCGGAVWLWRGQQTSGPAAQAEVAAAPRPIEVRKAQELPKAAEPRVTAPPPDAAGIAADAKTLVVELFAADTPERRAACIHDAEKYSVEIEAQFGATGAQKTELRQLARIPGMPLLLPGGEPALLFKLVTSACARGALVRLKKGADGKRRIYWPLLYETHAAKLVAYMQQQPTAEAVWFHVGLRPSHGLDIPAELRPKYLTFDVQVAAGSDPHFVLCVERDTPLGRFMDRETEWGWAYLARLLVRKLDIQADAPCLLVIDCEGAPER